MLLSDADQLSSSSSSTLILASSCIGQHFRNFFLQASKHRVIQISSYDWAPNTPYKFTTLSCFLVPITLTTMTIVTPRLPGHVASLIYLFIFRAVTSATTSTAR